MIVTEFPMNKSYLNHNYLLIIYFTKTVEGPQKRVEYLYKYASSCKKKHKNYQATEEKYNLL